MNTFRFEYKDGTSQVIVHTCTNMLTSQGRLKEVAQRSPSMVGYRKYSDINRVVYSTKHIDFGTNPVFRARFIKFFKTLPMFKYFTKVGKDYEYELSLGKHYARDLLCVSILRYVEERGSGFSSLLEAIRWKKIPPLAVFASIAPYHKLFGQHSVMSSLIWNKAFSSEGFGYEYVDHALEAETQYGVDALLRQYLGSKYTPILNNAKSIDVMGVRGNSKAWEYYL